MKKSFRTTAVAAIAGFLLLGGCGPFPESVRLTAYLVPDNPAGQVAARSCNAKFPAESANSEFFDLDPNERPRNYYTAAVGCLRTIPRQREVILTPKAVSGVFRYDDALAPIMRSYGCRNVRSWDYVYTWGVDHSLYEVHHLLLCDPGQLGQ
jgi:hypothetical protein